MLALVQLFSIEICGFVFPRLWYCSVGFSQKEELVEWNDEAASTYVFRNPLPYI